MPPPHSLVHSDQAVHGFILQPKGKIRDKDNVKVNVSEACMYFQTSQFSFTASWLPSTMASSWVPLAWFLRDLTVFSLHLMRFHSILVGSHVTLATPWWGPCGPLWSRAAQFGNHWFSWKCLWASLHVPQAIFYPCGTSFYLYLDLRDLNHSMHHNGPLQGILSFLLLSCMFLFAAWNACLGHSVTWVRRLPMEIVYSCKWIKRLEESWPRYEAGASSHIMWRAAPAAYIGLLQKSWCSRPIRDQGLTG